jgi:hypothetical protein
MRPTAEATGTIGSATVIPFPSRRRPASEAAGSVPQNAGGDPAQERLLRALAGLEDALARQRAAVAAWRGSLADLGTATSGLGTTLQSYRDNLEALRQRVAGLHTASVRLERSADWAVRR